MVGWEQEGGSPMALEPEREKRKEVWYDRGLVWLSVSEGLSEVSEWKY